MTGQDDGGDFASAAMMRLVAAGLARQGIAPPGPPPPGARVPRPQKREVLAAILAAHGPVAILSIADAARHMPPEPVVQALLRARDTADLLDRWHRLERFSHGRHTIETQSVGDGSFRLSHRARDGGPPPSFGESLLVLGVLTILAEMIGGVDVTLATDAGEIWRGCGIWHFPSLSGAVGSLLLSAPAQPMRRQSTGAAGTDPLDALRQRLAADPVRRWTLAALAAETATSPRTLQRRLAREHVTFSRLVSEARLEVAAIHLCDAAGPGLAEIGFLAGSPIRRISPACSTATSELLQAAIGLSSAAFRSWGAGTCMRRTLQRPSQSCLSAFHHQQGT